MRWFLHALPYDISRDIFKNAVNNSGTEYLTFYIKNNEQYFRTGSAPVESKHKKKIRLTIDNKKDLKFVKPFLEKMKKKGKIENFNIDDIFNFYGMKKNKQKNIEKKIIINTELKKNSYKNLI